ncbi:MAG TPA: PASTA domain-containing protein [Balneolaceae bacterium]|nr:PASTA domain-containing protein [Balneolaceae bacterium]|tara:strand:+ start:45628 stop:46455 length:828 start_codon:yes stop_codon:yes gene_type:complete
MLLIRILKNKYLYISIFTLMVIGAGTLLLFDKVLMPVYTNYNEGVTVPDVTRISLDEAEELLTSYGLRFEVADRRANSAFPGNYVIDQAPSAEVIVKPNRKIYLTVNAATKPTVKVPNVVNLSLRNAQIQLQNYGLEVGSISYESSRFKNAVLRQSISEGSVVEKGTTINLVISDGLGDKIVKIPEIVGLRLPDAQLKLREIGLRVGEIRFQPIKDVVPNTVLDYTPKVSELVEGESLNLVISERFDAVELLEGGAVFSDSTKKQPGQPQPDIKQ